MDVFLLLIVLVFLIIINNKISKKFLRLNEIIQNLTERVRNLQEKVASNAVPVKEEKVIVSEVISKPIIVEKPIIVVPEKVEIQDKTFTTLKVLDPIEGKKSLQKTIREPVKYVPKKSMLERFKEKNPDIEKFIGENLINKIGILILVLGVSFFVKYAIDKEWINEPARVGVGVLCGSLVMAIAHKLKKNYASFSSVLIAGAISIFYFTIYIAFHEYQLFSQTVAFIIMVVITAFSTLVSVSYNRQELAILSLIGGFAVPFMLSTGEGNYIVLFTYIAILNTGILAISYFKKWKIATIIAFVLTTLFYIVWLLLNIEQTDFSHTGALIFATVFYFIFSITIVLNNLKNKGVFSTIEYFILIINTFFFFGVGMLILRNLDSNLTGLFTLLLAIYNVLYAAVLYKKFGLDKNAIYLLIGLALTFVTLTIPIQFKGNQITLFWAVEAVLLLWLSQKSKIEFFKLGAIIVQVLAVISLMLDWKRYAFTEELSIIFNPLFIAGFIVSFTLFLTYWLLKKEKDFVTKFFSVKISFYKTFVLLGAIGVTYFTGILEMHYQAFQFLENKASAFSIPITYHFVFIAILLYGTTILKKKIITKGILILSIGSVFLYIVKLYALPSEEIIENSLYNTSSKYAFYLHYIVIGCLVYFGYQLFKKTTMLFNIKPTQSKWIPWVFVFAIVYVLSNEVMIHSLHFLNSVDPAELLTRFPNLNTDMYEKSYFIDQQVGDSKAQIIKIGYPILWGMFSFIFLIIGIKKQWKNLRIIALSLLGLTIVKLFVYDIKNVSETGKIVAFILLGILVLVISFVYQKIKKLVVDESLKDKIEDEKI